MIVEKIIGTIEDFKQENLKTDRILLDHDDMNKPHQKLKSESGQTVAVSLPHGENLFCGAVLYKDSEKIIAVDLVEEDVLEIRPEGNIQWAKAAFNIGNMHHPAYIHRDCICISYDSILEKMMGQMGISCERKMRKLDGHRANHVVGGHTHSHTHGHHHHHREQE